MAGCDRRGDGLLPKRKTRSLSPGEETTSRMTCPLRSPPPHTWTLPAVTAPKCRGGKRDKGHCHLQSRLTARVQLALKRRFTSHFSSYASKCGTCMPSVSPLYHSVRRAPRLPPIHRASTGTFPTDEPTSEGTRGGNMLDPPQRTEGQALLLESGPARPKSPLGQGPNTLPS